MTWENHTDVKLLVGETEVNKMEKPKEPTKSSEFDFSEDTNLIKEVYTIWGRKGEGKTSLALGFPGTKCCISFDNKTIQTKNNVYKDEDNIHVWSGIKYYDSSTPNVLDSAEKSLKYIYLLIKNVIAEKEPDWILFDGLEVFIRMAEFLMRKRNFLKPYQGISNLNVWKERNSYIDKIHNLALRTAKKGVIYTTYTERKEVIKDGTVVERDESPKWMGDVMLQTDFTLNAYSTFNKEEGKKFFVHINNSKNDKRLKTGTTHDITGKTLEFGE